MCQECVEISKMDIPAKWYRINGAIKGDAPDNIKLSNFLRRILPKTGDRYCFIKNKDKVLRSREKLEVICAVHGSFMMTQAHLIEGKNCPKCSGTAKSNTLDFITKAKLIHKETYIYDQVDYINAHTNITIICSVHGHFSQLPHVHLGGKSGCPVCAKESYSADVSTRGLYIMYSVTLGTYKIGITNNIHKRLLRLNQTGEKFNLINFYDLNNNEHSMKLEKYLHQHFRDKQCKEFLETDLDGKTELFNLNEEDLQYIDEYIKEYCKNNNLTLG